MAYRQPESHHVYNRDKKSNHSNACCDLKGLVPVGNPCLLVESTRICHEIVFHAPTNRCFFEKDQEEFWALITQERSQYPNSGGCIRPHGSIT